MYADHKTGELWSGPTRQSMQRVDQFDLGELNSGWACVEVSDSICDPSVALPGKDERPAFLN
jgi:hypothetical protein